MIYDHRLPSIIFAGSMSSQKGLNPMSTRARTTIELPPGCVTGVGSLPFMNAEEAVRFVANWSPVLPFWPQLPRRCAGEGVIAQGLGALAAFIEPAAKPFCWQLRPGKAQAFAVALDANDACLIPATAAGFFAFETAFQAGVFPDAVAVKAQLEGPATLAHCVFVDGLPLACQPDWLGRVTSFIARQAVWQVNRLQRLGKPVVFVVDEPAISLALSGASPVRISEIVAAITSVLHAVREAGAAAGLHCCAPMPVGLVQALNLDLVSFDAHLPISSENWFDLAHSVVARSGHVAFGLVPTSPNSEFSTPDLFARWLRFAATAGDVIEIANKTIVTATCGLGLATPITAISVFERCQQVGKTIGRLACVPCV